ncbi:MAG: tRNA (adenosine(37)-N6)-threonylcarbamoyltransferase complex transferase subunit TsaD [Rickettsiaceae bacterium]|nr:tRNA (adenosine(37)-N6)-threonylcarbamoyltransferase complex transferase subunit TsaD [Rickettsiaceae bacterium]
MTLILGIESSCDDTAAAIVTSDRKILSNIVLSQVKEHMPYKGVVPEIASRAHMNYLEYAIKEALRVADVSMEEIDAIAATGGPGLIGGVIVGTMFGKALASCTGKAFIAVNHLEAHALTARLTHNIEFPYLLLLISGGHCQFLIAKNVGDFQLLGQTMDDALGEAFDKVAKMLELDYPGGPIIEKLASTGDPNKYKLPMPMCDREACDMSFSGLKTAVRILIQKQSELQDENFLENLSASFQFTVLKILEYKILRAVHEYEKNFSNKKLVISGGVAANQYLMNSLKTTLKKRNYELISPPINLCTDNASMVAWAGMEKFTRGEFTPLNFCPKARWPIYNL